MKTLKLLQSHIVSVLLTRMRLKFSFAACFIIMMLGSTCAFAQTADLPSEWISPDILKAATGQRPNVAARGTGQAQILAVPSSANPDIPQSLLCQDLRVVFVLDESGSITGSEITSVETGAKALANALLNSGASLRLVEFNTRSTIVDLGGTLVNSTFITNLNSYLGAGFGGQNYNPVSSGTCVGWTNWQDALEDVATLDADLVIFFTDGNPTAYNVASGGDCFSTVNTGVTPTNVSIALDPAITQANLIKGQGKHMFIVGVGSDLNLDNIKAISGNDAFGPDHDILTADYTLPPFDQLAANLTAAVNAICGTELLIDKIPSQNGVCAGQSVTFTNSITNTGGDFNFTALNVVVSDVYPNGYSNLQFVPSAPPGASISGNTVTYNIGDMVAGATVTYQISATVLVPTPPKNYNSIVTGSAFNANTVNDNAVVASGYATGELTVDPSCSSPVTVNGVDYNASGTYTQTLVSAAGCDSILTIHVTINQPTSSTEKIVACDGYTWHGTYYTESNSTATWTGTNAAGCDSVVTLNLTINYSTVNDNAAGACDSYTWSVNGETYTQSGFYSYVTTNADGCTHTENLNLLITYSSSSTTTIAECGSYTWPATGITYTETGIYSTTYPNADGCTHTETLDLTINPGTSNTSTVVECDSYTWPVDGVTYTQSGTYTNVSSNGGCPHTETLELTINHSSSNTSTVKQCGSYTWPVNGTTYTESGIYTSTSTNAEGCTHTETLDLTIGNGSTVTTTIVQCNSYTWPVNGVTYTASGTYNVSTTDAAGCVNKQTLELTINKKPTIGTITGPCNVCRKQTNVQYSVAAVAGATSYTWTLPSGVTGSSTTNSISVAIGTSFTTGVIKVRANNACGSSADAQITLVAPTAVPPVPGTISGPATICGSGSFTYSIAAVTGATSYIWSVSGSGLSISGSNTGTSVTVVATASCTSGSVSVKAVNCIGSCVAKTLSLSFSKLPAKPGAISGPINNLCRKTDVVFSVAAVAGATSYEWTLPTGVTYVSGANTNSIKVNFGTSVLNACSISVKAKNGCGTSAASTLALSLLPPAPTPGSGSLSVRKTQKAVIYSVIAVPGATSYTWTITGGAKFVGSSTGSSVTVNFTTATSATATISVKANNACGSSPAASVNIAVSGVTTYARGFAPGSAVESAIEEKVVTNVYPNPNNGSFTVNFSNNKTEKVLITVTDAVGKVVYKSANTYTEGPHNERISLSGRQQGVYFVRIQGEQEKVLKVIIR